MPLKWIYNINRVHNVCNAFLTGYAPVIFPLCNAHVLCSGTQLFQSSLFNFLKQKKSLIIRPQLFTKIEGFNDV